MTQEANREGNQGTELDNAYGWGGCGFSGDGYIGVGVVLPMAFVAAALWQLWRQPSVRRHNIRRHSREPGAQRRRAARSRTSTG